VDPVDGVVIYSPSNREYCLLEGHSYLGKSSSDIVFIFETDNSGYKRLVNFTFGAGFVDDCLQNCAEYIEDYEAGKQVDLSHDLTAF